MLEVAKSVHLDFGCGLCPRNPFGAQEVISIDLKSHSENLPTHIVARGDPIPFPDNFFTSVSTYDVLEHLSRDSIHGNEFVFIMNELYRVLKPGGVAVHIFPAFPHTDAFSDPTHVNFITSRTLDYFVGKRMGDSYAGICTEFEVIMNKRLRVWKEWVDNAVIDDQLNDLLSWRRRLSLARRTMLRLVFPQHRMWLLRKPSE